ncbi:MAG TPA: peptide deformylase [Clostridiaceae bacterium]|nr:peptide deformylase [Clostridiaceae bacterium]
MATRKIITIGEDILRKKARRIDKIDDRILQLIEDMKDTLAESGNGIGLAAPQVGMLKRIFIVDLQDDQGLTVYINPEIIETEGSQIGPEGCLSVPGKTGDVERPAKIKIRAQNEKGEIFEEEAEELRAVCICHENDHLNGVLFPDRVKGALTDV